MQTDALLREDHHVHSTFSDGRSTLEEIVARKQIEQENSMPNIEKGWARIKDALAKLK